MFGNLKLASYIAHEISICDSECRLELNQRIIVDEPDYVAAFSKSIRKEVKNPKVRVHAQTLPGGQEQNNGADGIMVFQIGNEVKVGIFESKWPRFLQNN